MTREEYVLLLIKRTGMTKKEFAASIELPYTTLLSILNGNIGGASMDNVTRICNGLGIGMDVLNGVLPPHSERSRPALAPQSNELLGSAAHLDMDDPEAVREYNDFLEYLKYKYNK